MAERWRWFLLFAYCVLTGALYTPQKGKKNIEKKNELAMRILRKEKERIKGRRRRRKEAKIKTA